MIGDVFAGLFSQYLGSRKRAILVFLCLTALFTGVYGFANGVSAAGFYGICFLLGLGTGLGSAFVADRVVIPLELGRLRVGHSQSCCYEHDRR